MNDFFAQFQVSTRITLRANLVDDCAAELAELAGSRALLVTDAGLVRCGVADRVRRGLQTSGVDIVGQFADIPPNSSLPAVEQLVAAGRDVGADRLIAVGGGSVIDSVKLAALLLTHGGTPDDYAGAQTVPGPLLPMIAIPTTAGTGSEVTQAAVIFDPATQRKLSFVDTHLRPHVALLDPTLSVGLPPLLTAATAMDAVTHAIEAVVDIQHGPFSDACAVHALQLIRVALPRAIADGADLTARADLLAAATLAGIAFDHSMVGVVHAVSHAVGALAHVHHGTANSIFLPLGFDYNRDVAQNRYAQLARWLGLSASGDDRVAMDALVGWVAALRDDLWTSARLARTVADAGVDRALIPHIAALAEEDGASFYNPRPVEAEALAAWLTTHWGN